MKTKNLIFFIAAALIASCSKDKTDTSNPGTASSYINVNPSSTWTYNELDSSGSTPKSADYSVTSTSNDTTINSRKYHIYTYSFGGSQYLNLSGNDYYQYDTVPGGGSGNVERLYLKDNAAVGTIWTQNFTLSIPDVPIPIPLTVTNKIVEKDISRTVNNISYSHVIHVSSSLSSALITTPSAFTSNIDSYYAENYGLIENSTAVHLDYQGLTKNINIKTQLTGAVLK